MLVVDASVLYEVVTAGAAAEPLRRRFLDEDLAAPHIVDVEVLGVIRREHLLGGLDSTAAALALRDLQDWRGDRYDHRPLLGRAWELRHTVRGWDAMYVALAESLDAPLLTSDSRLAAATGPTCAIEVLRIG
ncbi:MAG: type II toxin-antitoxin system VapC family toxin [Micrococcales bacterium]|nr:type II toxin-antitoxin system VapC family toxin [Micrococcales bacterium]